MHIRTFAARGIAAVASFAVVGTAAAQNLPVLLEIDISDPTAVTITSTGAAAVVDDASLDDFDGITLDLFFTAFNDVPFSDVVGDLTVPGALAYDRFFDVSSGLDLNLYNNLASDALPQVFTTLSPAFTGSSFLDVDLTGAPFQADGYVGTINNGLNNGPILGSYVVVVPEPANATALLGTAGLLLVRRRK